jgi:hypothetical protein
MYRNQHHPSDVIVAVWFAGIFSIPLGLAVRRSRRSRRDGDLNTDPEGEEEDDEDHADMGEARSAPLPSSSAGMARDF